LARNAQLQRFSRLFVAASLWMIGAFVFGPLAEGQDLSPEHERVKKMIGQAVQFLSSKSGSLSEAEGYKLLRAYALYKATENSNHPVVKTGYESAKNLVKSLPTNGGKTRQNGLYDACVAGMLLVALDPNENRPDIEAIRDFLYSAQKPSGGFGYLMEHQQSQGDISQCQYVALCFWAMNQAKVELDQDRLERFTRWLIQAQRQDGSWTYQVPNEGDSPRHTMVGAGLSAVLLAADTVGWLRNSKALIEEDDSDDTVPRAFRRVMERKDGADKLGDTSAAVRQAASKAKGWLARNAYNRKAANWHYYWVYSIERFESFIELMEGKRPAQPTWYTAGVVELERTQAKNGSWGDGEDYGPDSSTSFAILFLLRATQKAIGDLKSADSIGGFGLANVADVGMVDGKLVDKAKVTSIEDALAILEDKSAGSTNDKLLAERLTLDADPKKKKDQLNRFARMLRSPDYRARRIAAKMLGRGDDLDFAPDLIYALGIGEQDKEVPHIAENSLRLLSRQLDTRKLPDKETLTVKDRLVAEQYWKAWYLSLRPDHVFVSE
jgi:hypothetical protein